jgi:hypothetical protein
MDASNWLAWLDDVAFVKQGKTPKPTGKPKYGAANSFDIRSEPTCAVISCVTDVSSPYDFRRNLQANGFR